jgi:hypothetical protein
MSLLDFLDKPVVYGYHDKYDLFALHKDSIGSKYREILVLREKETKECTTFIYDSSIGREKTYDEVVTELYVVTQQTIKVSAYLIGERNYSVEQVKEKAKKAKLCITAARIIDELAEVKGNNKSDKVIEVEAYGTSCRPTDLTGGRIVFDSIRCRELTPLYVSKELDGVIIPYEVGDLQVYLPDTIVELYINEDTTFDVPVSAAKHRPNNGINDVFRYISPELSYSQEPLLLDIDQFIEFTK